MIGRMRRVFIGWRELIVSKGRFALVGLVVALVALLSTFLTGLANGLVDDGISGLRGLPLTHLAFLPDSGSSFSRSTLNDEHLEAWERVEGAESSPVGVSFFNARAADGKTIDVALFGIAPGSFLAPRQDAQDALGGTAGIVLSEEFASSGLEVGDVLVIVGPDVELPILGFTYGGSYGHVDLAFTSLETWQMLVYGDDARGRFSAVALDLSDAGDVDIAAVDARAGTETQTKETAYAGSPGYAAETATMTLIRGFLLVISALVVGAFFTVWTIQRTKQIGLMKAMGASTAYVIRDALGQLLVILVIATVIGSGIGVLLGGLMGDEAPFNLQLKPVLMGDLALIVLGVIGCLAAVRRIARVQPIVAMSSEG